MNLLEAISLSELQAGGPGSGCRGPNCGRPRVNREVTDQDIEKVWKKTPAPQRVNIAFPKITPKNAPARELSVPQKMFRQYMKKQAEGVEKMQPLIPTAKSSDGTLVKEKDIVKLLKPDTLWNTKTGDIDKFAAGKLKGVIVNVLPKVGDNQLVKVNILPPTKKHEADQFRYIPAQDVKLYKAAGPTTVDTEPVPKSRIKQQFISNDGAQVTIVKSQETRDYNPRTIKDMANQPSRYKGQFDLIEKVDGADGQTTRVYDTSRASGEAWRQEGGTALFRPGAVVFVDRYPDHVTIEERSYQRMGFKGKGRVQWRYNNIGQAFGMLKKRYGISIPLSQERF